MYQKNKIEQNNIFLLPPLCKIHWGDDDWAVIYTPQNDKIGEIYANLKQLLVFNCNTLKVKNDPEIKTYVMYF